MSISTATTYRATLIAAAALLLMAWLSYTGERREQETHMERREVDTAYSGGPRSEEDKRRMFAEFMAKHGRAYDSMTEQEQERRYAAFKESLYEADILTISPFNLGERSEPMDMLREREEVVAMFKAWTAKHGKTYASSDEYDRRFFRFIFNVDRVDMHNHAALSSYRQSLDRFADLTYHQVPGAHHRGTGGLFNNNHVGMNMFVGP